MKRLIIILFVACSCSSEDDVYVQYPIELEPYIKEFEQRAKERNAFFRWDGLVIILNDTLPEKYSGYYKPREHKIYLDSDSWQFRTQPEELVMHELGHAVLKRMHDDSRMPNKMYRSVMGNTASAFYSGWSYIDSIAYREKYYYDELFNSMTPNPIWATK